MTENWSEQKVMGKGGQICVKGIWVKALKPRSCLLHVSQFAPYHWNSNFRKTQIDSKLFISIHAHVYGLPVGFEKFAQQISAQFDWEFGSKPLEGIK